VIATANSGYSFSGFSGALSGTATPQFVTMNAAESVTAGFSATGVSISSITLNSASNNITLPSGQTANLVVLLNGPAPAGGVTFSLTPTNPYDLLLQGTVAIAQGATSSPVVIVTAMSTGTAPVQATISANGGLFGTLISPVITVTASYTISGTVVQAGESTPLSGVTVSLGGSGTASVLTAANGSYSFTVPAGSYTVGVAMPGYGFNPGTWANSSLSSNQPGVSFSGGVRTVGTPAVLPGTPSSCNSGNAILNNGAAQSLAYCLGYFIGGVFYCNDSDNGAHTSAFSVSGSGVTASLAGSPSQCAPGHPSTFDVSFTAAAGAAPTSRNMSFVYSDRASNESLTIANALQIYDTTPFISGVGADPPPIYAGSQGYVSIYGSNFGSVGYVQVCTNPTGSCAVAPGFSNSVTYWPACQVNPCQINILLTTPSYSAGGTYYLQVVVSADDSGAAFLASAQESNGNASNESPFAVAAPSLTININNTPATSDDITILGQTIPGQIILQGASGTVQLSASPAGRVSLSASTLTLTNGAPGSIIITPLQQSQAANDLVITATFSGASPATANMTVVNVSFATVCTVSGQQTQYPNRIFNCDTPPGMPDRIPPTATTPIQVTIAPSLSGTGQNITLATSGTNSANGVFTIAGNSTLALATTTTISLSGSAQTTPTAGAGGGNASNLALTAQAHGATALLSNGFSVAAIPLNWVCTSGGPIIDPDLYGLIVNDSWASDSGNINDLKNVEVSERVAVASPGTGALAGVGAGDTSGYLPATAFTEDDHQSPISAITAPGVLVLNQITTIFDPRTGAIDVPMANSGFTISRVITQDASGVLQRFRNVPCGQVAAH
jgi:hypothetical protein